MKVKPRGIEIPLIIVLVVLSIFVLGTLGLIIMRLGKTGVFSNQVAYTEEVTTRAEDEVITTKRVTTTAAQVTTTEKAAAAEKETEKETETTVKETETTTAETTTETKPEETKAPQTKASEAKTEKSDTTKKSEKKTDTTKKEESKTEKTTETTAKENEEKDPFALYQKYVKDELVPKYGLAAAGEEKRALDNKGITSVMIRDFSNSGDQEMLLIRIEPSNQYYAPYPVFELYGIKDGKVEMLNSVVCNDSMGGEWDFHLMSEWNIRNDGNSVYLWAKQADVGGAEENIRITEIDLTLTNHKVQAVKKSTTTGDPNGPEKSFSVEAFWVCEVINRLSETDRGNEGRVYKMNDYTGLRDWIK